MSTLRSPRPWLLVAAVGVGALAATGLLAFLVPIAHERDAAALQQFTELDRPRTYEAWSQVRSLCDPQHYAVLGSLLVLIALARRRLRTAGSVAFLLVVTGVTTLALKPLIDAPRFAPGFGYEPIGASSWPSGHSTAGMTLALCLVLVAPPRLRPSAGIAGALFALVIGVSNLVLELHWPSDVVGGYLVAGSWAALVLAALSWLEARRPSPRPERDHPLVRGDIALPLAATAVVGVVAAGIVLDRAGNATDFIVDHPTLLLVGSVIAGLAVLLPLGLTRGTT